MILPTTPWKKNRTHNNINELINGTTETTTKKINMLLTKEEKYVCSIILIARKKKPILSIRS